MQPSGDEIVQKARKRCGHCNRNMLLPYGVVLLVVTTQLNKSINSLKYNAKE